MHLCVHPKKQKSHKKRAKQNEDPIAQENSRLFHRCQKVQYILLEQKTEKYFYLKTRENLCQIPSYEIKQLVEKA